MQGVEGDPDHTSIFKDAGYDGKGPSNNWNERVVDMNTLRPDRRSRGHIGKKGEAGGVETDWRCESDGNAF